MRYGAYCFFDLWTGNPGALGTNGNAGKDTEKYERKTAKAARDSGLLIYNIERSGTDCSVPLAISN